MRLNRVQVHFVHLYWCTICPIWFGTVLLYLEFGQVPQISIRRSISDDWRWLLGISPLNAVRMWMALLIISYEL